MSISSETNEKSLLLCCKKNSKTSSDAANSAKGVSRFVEQAPYRTALLILPSPQGLPENCPNFRAKRAAAMRQFLSNQSGPFGLPFGRRLSMLLVGNEFETKS
eukprot:1160611-Pelagomonas_calceolata.AAC.7